VTSLPASLLRFFKEEEHARQFLSGAARFGLLEYYRKIEDIRRDTREGESSVYFNTPQPIHSTVVSLDRYYILCTSHPDVNIPSQAKKYGRFMVRITNSSMLLERIKEEWKNYEDSSGAFTAPVIYTKDELREPDTLLLSPPELVYSQKLRSYEDDREYRYLLCRRFDVRRKVWEEHLTLTLPDCRDICSDVILCGES
jgi:hypothetical protein